MEELLIEEKAKRYDKALKEAVIAHKDEDRHLKATLERIFPELKESEDEKIRKEMLDFFNGFYNNKMPKAVDVSPWIAWLEKQYEQKPCMIQWQGNNLKEVIDFVGKDKNFEKWFKSFEEYEKYVHEHNDIFKLFNEDGSHYEVPVGAWIVKTPDGYNVASKALFKNKPIKWSNEDEKMCLKAIKYIQQSYYSEEVVVDWLKSLKDRVQPQQNQEWSEEDEKMLSDINVCIKNLPIFYKSININGEDKITERFVCDVTNWLKSLKERYTWKPSDEQMDVLLGEVIAWTKGCPKQIVLESLYNDLKKLREE